MAWRNFQAAFLFAKRPVLFLNFGFFFGRGRGEKIGGPFFYWFLQTSSFSFFLFFFCFLLAVFVFSWCACTFFPLSFFICLATRV
ncbi:hypothetical protein BDY21DRAFT_158851 [Lineolata rhizophorae]|uniref:Uncharacterized protein n=1 Tax=Lineolata rhizophorae TaxID=578093 RepID=A0A6A6NLH0_9PEZI|nr:hypothetical protein BDY21DRAFT_158851 [Lineolata rhizophorae]